MSSKDTWKVSCLAIAAVFLVAFAVGLRPSASAAQSSVVWRAEYYDNVSLAGTPVAVVEENEIDHRWLDHGPGYGLGPNYFGARWTTTVNLPDGVYLFKAYTDDGIRLFVDGQMVIDKWVNRTAALDQAQLVLEAGIHTVRADYYQHIGDATALIWWEWLTGSVAPQWRVEYFNNPYLSGSPVLVRDEAESINHSWGTGSPDPSVAADYFSVRYTGSIHFELDGVYTFTLTADDGARLWVDGGMLVDQWSGQAGQTGVVPRNVTMGVHPVIVEYYENTGDASITLSWSYGAAPGAQPTAVPTGVPTAQPPAPSGEVIVDNLDAGFQKGGPSSSWYYRSVGYQGHTYWTYNSDAQVYNYGQWVPQLPQAGTYTVYAFIPRQRADTHNAGYRIRHNGEDHYASLDQSTYFDEWVTLGSYSFGATGDEYVYLDDVTGESYASRKIAFDAIKFAGTGAAGPTATAVPTTPVPTATPTTPVPAATPTGTTVAPTATPTIPACSITPILGFGEIWNTYADVRDRLGCPVELETSTWSAEESFIGGYTFWRGDLRLIYALYNDGTWQSFVDTWNEGDLEWDSTIVPPSGYYQPKRGFGKVWREQAGVRDKLSWATTEERGLNASWQAYQGGLMLWSDALGFFVLYNDGTWSRYS